MSSPSLPDVDSTPAWETLVNWDLFDLLINQQPAVLAVFDQAPILNGTNLLTSTRLRGDRLHLQ